MPRWRRLSDADSERSDLSLALHLSPSILRLVRAACRKMTSESFRTQSRNFSSRSSIARAHVAQFQLPTPRPYRDGLGVPQPTPSDPLTCPGRATHLFNQHYDNITYLRLPTTLSLIASITNRDTREHRASLPRLIQLPSPPAAHSPDSVSSRQR